MLFADFNIYDEYNIVFVAKGYKTLCFIDDKLVTYKYGNIFLMDLYDFSKEFICNLCLDKSTLFFSKNRLLTRLLRLEPRGVAKRDNNSILFSLKGYIYHLNIATKESKAIHKFRNNMSALVYLTTIEDLGGFTVKHCYSEYFTNNEKNEISIYGCYGDLSDWREIYRFEKGQINHIHSIIPDPYQKKVWIFTGDFGDAAGIWYTDDDFRTVNRYLFGNQQYRARVGMPTEDGLIYATDTPMETNSIYIVSKDKEIKKLFELEGPSLYGAEYQNKYIFSTVVECDPNEKWGKTDIISYKRGKGIKSWYSHLVIGNLEEGFKTIAKFKKDIFPMGLFQFGTITFPQGKNLTNKIILYGNSLKNIDGKMIIMERKTI